MSAAPVSLHSAAPDAEKNNVAMPSSTASADGATSASGLPVLDLREMFKVLWRRRWIIGGTVALVAIAGFGVIGQITPRYTASATLMVDPRQANVVDLDQVIAGLPANVETIQSEIEILRSRALAGRVVDALRLTDNPAFNAGLAKDQPSVLRNKVMDRFLDGLAVKSVGRSRVIEIDYTSTSPALAANLAQTVAELYLDGQLETKFEATRRASTWLSERMEQLRVDAEASELAVERFKSAISQNRDPKTLAAKAQTVAAALVTARTARDEAKDALDKLQKFEPLRLPEGAPWPSDELQKRYDAVEAMQTELAALSETLGPKHPDRVAAQAKLDDATQRYQGALNALITTAQDRVRASQQKMVELQAEQAQVVNLVDDPAAADVRLNTLKREAQASRALYETFLTRFKETSEQQGLEQADARLISTPDVPATPSYPNKKVLFLLTLVAGFGLGLVLAFAAEQLENGFYSPEQIERLTGLPALGQIPTLASLGVKGETPESYLVKKPASSYAEAVRSLRTSLMLSGGDHPPRVLLLTSSLPGEGKTTLTLALARLAAMAGERVVVVDADLRRPRVHAALGVENKAGLTEYLCGQLPLDKVISQTDKEGKGVHYMTAGQPSSLATELVRSKAMKALLQTLSQSYSMVIVDGPPVLPVADAKVLSTLVDKVVFVSTWRKTPRAMVQQALKQLRDVGAPLAGLVLNNINMKRHGDYSQGYSGYYAGKAYRRYYVE